jgi:hypothetical protein
MAWLLQVIRRSLSKVAAGYGQQFKNIRAWVVKELSVMMVYFIALLSEYVWMFKRLFLHKANQFFYIIASYTAKIQSVPRASC